MTAILVDDLPQAMRLLESDLKELYPSLRIIGRAEGVVSAAKLLRKQEPDLLFLDIMLGDGTGFDLLEIFPDLRSRLIFVTASNEHAIRAFRFAAVDYLLKPVNPDELRDAVDRAVKQVLPPPPGKLELLKETLDSPDKLPSRISLPGETGIDIVEVADIVRCRSEVNNTHIYLRGGQQLFLNKTLKYYDEMLRDHGFVRVHQSHLVNPAYIDRYVRENGGSLLLRNGESVPVSTRKRSAVLALLEGWG
ncbi:MAG: LytTR family DNA-binding domain-containing protein [Saprospiraceae bacterium]